MPFELSGQPQQRIGRERVRANWTGECARGEQSGHDGGRGRAKTEALRYLVPAMKDKPRRLPAADGGEGGPHGPDDQMLLAALDGVRHRRRTCAPRRHPPGSPWPGPCRTGLSARPSESKPGPRFALVAGTRTVTGSGAQVSTSAPARQSGSHHAGSQHAGSHHAGSRQTGSQRTGSQRTGSQRTGSQQTGSQQTGHRRPSASAAAATSMPTVTGGGAPATAVSGSFRPCPVIVHTTVDPRSTWPAALAVQQPGHACRRGRLAEDALPLCQEPVGGEDLLVGHRRRSGRRTRLALPRPAARTRGCRSGWRWRR